MCNPSDIKRSHGLAPLARRLAVALIIANAMLPLCNTLRAENLGTAAVSSVAKMDSLFRTVYNPESDPGSGSGWTPFSRMEWFYGQRAFPSGNIPPEARMNAWLQKQSRRGHRTLDENWTALGPTALAGRALSIAWHPTNTNILYVGSASGGLWKSTNAGSSWIPVTDNLPTLAVGAVALDPQNANTVYIGTGEGALNVDAVYGAGIFKSTDGGTSWNTTGMSWQLFLGRAINKIVVHPTNSQILWAATNAANGGGVYKSTDGGASWTLHLSGDAKDLTIRSDSTNILYAALGYPFGDAGNGIYRSTDGGLTWNPVMNGMPSVSLIGRLQVSISPSNPQVMYAGISRTLSGGSNLLGIYKTTNAGANWTLQANTPNMYGGQGWYDLACKVHPTNPAIVYSGGIECYKSTDSGVSWTQKSFSTNTPGSSQYAHAGHHDLAFKPGDPNTIITVTDGGLFKSTNGGDTWSSLNNGLVTCQFYTAGNSLQSSDLIYGGAQDNGSQRYSGSTWSSLLGGDGGACNVDFGNANTIYAEMARGAHYKSTNGGTSFATIQSGITGSGAWVTPVVMAPDDASVLYTGTNQVYRTSNGGTNWSVISPAFGNDYISSIAVAPSNPSILCATWGSDGVVARTVNGGTNWSNISTGLPAGFITRIAIDPADPNTMYVTYSGYGISHVWKTTNGGASWSSFSTGLLDVPCNAIVIDPLNSSNLYLGTDLGVYASTNGGTSWTDYSSGLPNVVVDDLSLNPATGLLRAATHGRGMWQTATVTPPLSVLYPIGGESWLSGTVHNIVWATGGLGGHVRIELNRNYPAGTWETLIASVTNNGAYSWTVSGTGTTHARIRVSSVETPSATDVCNGDFQIVQPVIAMLTPNGGEVWTTGTTQHISWSDPSGAGAYVIQINRNYPSATWVSLGHLTTSYLDWTVYGPTGSSIRFRVILEYDHSVGDTIDANMSIVDPIVTLTYPNGGETFTPGSTQIIRWTRTYYTGTVSLAINHNYPLGSWDTVGVGMSADSVQWTVDGTGSANTRIRVSATPPFVASDVSNGDFTILTPSLTLTSPNGGENWDSGTLHTIRWSRFNLIGPVSLLINHNYPAGSWVPFALSITADTLVWTVTEPMTNTARLRVAATYLPAVLDESDNNFTIGTGMVLSSPAGGESWDWGSIHSITWSRYNAAGAATVQLNRSYPSPVWETLTSSVTDSSYTWTISGSGTTTARVRVYLNSNHSIGDTCAANFTINAPALLLNAPNGGEVWNTGTQQTISWSRNNAPGNITVQLNRAYPSTTWETLTTTASGSSILWTATNPATASARVRIFLTSTPTTGDTSNANFAIASPGMMITSPNGGELWALGSTQIFTFTRVSADGAATVQIKRGYPNGSWETLNTNVTASSLSWTVSGATSTACRARVYLNSNTTVGDTSDANFSVVNPVLTVTSPNGGELWGIGDTATIAWTRSNADGPVTVSLNRTFPTGSWIVLSAGETGNTLSWPVTAPATASARVRVTLNSYSGAMDESNASFSIVQPSLSITAPDGGETYTVGAAVTMRWTRQTAPGAVTLLLNRAYPTGMWETLSTAVLADSFVWNSAGAPSSACRLKVRLNSDTTISDVSSGNFTLISRALTITAPNGGEAFYTGSPTTVTLARNNANTNVTIQLNRSYPSSNWETLSTTVSGTSYTWNVTGNPSSTARLRIFLTDEPFVGDTTNGSFVIVTPTLALTSPDDGEQWPVGSAQNITWLRNGVWDNVRIELNRTYPTGTWESIVATATGSSYAWTVTGPSSTTARVRVTSSANGAIGDTSAAAFTIYTSMLILNNPDGGDTLSIGIPYTIRWSRLQATGNVRVTLNRTYPTGAWETLGTTTADSLVWTVTSPVSSSARVRLYLVSDPTIADTSAASCAIVQPGLILTSPHGGERWQAGSLHTVTWTRSGLAGYVRAEYNQNYPSGSWTLIAGGQLDNSCPWILPQVNAPHARVRLLYESIPQYGDTSLDISIENPHLTVLWPNGGDTLRIGDSYVLRFSRDNHPDPVTLQINRTYPSSSWQTIALDVTADSAVWTPTGSNTSTARLRVLSTVFSTVGDTSNANFTLLVPQLTLTAPNGGALLVGDTTHVRWTRTAYSGTVSLGANYNYPDGVWRSIAASVSGDSFLWAVPDSVTMHARVRIQTTDGSLEDISDNNVTISHPTLALQNPLGGDTLLVAQSLVIRWNRVVAPGAAKVELNRSYPTGAWTTLIDSTMVDSLLWTVTAPVTNTARLRVSLRSTPLVNDISAANLSILAPNISLLTPTAGDSIALGLPVQFTWSGPGSSLGMNISVMRNWPTGTWETLASGITGNSWTWTAAGTASEAARFRIVSALVQSVGDTTDGAVRIGAPQFLFTQPQSSDTLIVGDQSTVSWTRHFAVGSVRVELSRQGASGPWVEIGATNGNSIAWTVTGPVTAAARFRVVLISAPAIFSMTPFNSAIVAPGLVFTSPSESGTDTIGTTLHIAWQWINASGAVRLDVSRDSLNGTWQVLADSLAGTNFTFAITEPETDSLRFRVTSLANPALFAVSPVRRVVLLRALELHVNGGDTWYVGQQKWIHWSRTNYSGTVNVDMTGTDRSQPWTPLATVSGDSFLWTVTGPDEDLVALRVSAAQQPDITDTTNAPLAIHQPSIEIVAPVGGDTLIIGQDIRLRWVGLGFYGGVAIGLWRGDPVNRLDTLFYPTPNDSSQIWHITGPAATGCALIVVSTSDTSIHDSSGFFAIIDPPDAITSCAFYPHEYSLSAPFPNPFNATSTMEFSLPHEGNVKLVVYDVLGREVSVLVDNVQHAGSHRVTWNAINAATGMYFIRMTAGDFVAVRRLQLIK
jgi:hypothetical protein